MALWNKKYLAAPPTNTYIDKRNNLDLPKFKNALQECIKHFKSEDFMIREAALLSRILYRMKMKFRSSKEFKALEKINHSLNNYLNANMVRDLKNIFDLMPTKYQNVTYLPTRNMLNYILIRIQGFVKLMERIYDTCQEAAYQINDKIGLGHFWKVYLVLFALISRLYVLVKINTQHLCELYGKLMPHLSKLENPGRNWLPDGYELPSDLREWLGVEWVYEEEFIDLTLDTSVKIIDFFNLVDDEDDEVQFCDEYVLIDEEDRSIAEDFRKLKPINETFTRNRMRGFSINEDDIGEEIAEIIKLNDRGWENIENDKKVVSPVSPPHKIIDVEDVGEELSSVENRSIDQLKIINLDETNKYFSKIDLTETSIKETPKKTKAQKREDKKNKKNLVINLTDESMCMKDMEVIVIPETPVVEKTEDNLEDKSVVFLDDTFKNTPVFTEKPNNLGFNILDIRAKKEKEDEHKTMDEAFKTSLSLDDKNISLDCTVLFNDSKSLFPPNSLRAREITKNSSKQNRNNKRKISESNILDIGKTEEKRPRKSEEISAGKKNIEKSLTSLSDLNNLIPQSPLKGEMASEKENSKPLNNEREISKSNNLTDGNIKTEEEYEEISLDRKYITCSSDSANIMKINAGEAFHPDGIREIGKRNKKKKKNQAPNSSKGYLKTEEHKNNDSEALKTKKMKTKKKKTKKKKKKKNNDEDPNFRRPEEYSWFTPISERTNKFKKGDREELNKNSLQDLNCHYSKRHKSKAAGRERSQKESKLKCDYEKRHANVVRLNLVKEVPNRKNSSQHMDKSAKGNTASEVKSPTKKKLIPCLDTPLQARLNVESLMTLSFSGGTPEGNMHNTPLKAEKEPGTKQTNSEFKEALCNIIPDKTRNKQFKMERAEKEKLKENILEHNKRKEKEIRRNFEESPLLCRRNSNESPFVFVRNPKSLDSSPREPKTTPKRRRRNRNEKPKSKFFRNDDQLYGHSMYLAKLRKQRERLNANNSLKNRAKKNKKRT